MRPERQSRAMHGAIAESAKEQNFMSFVLFVVSKTVSVTESNDHPVLCCNAALTQRKMP